MQSSITRLALFQFLAVFYCIVAMGVILKIRFGSPAPELLATHLRDYGFLLLLLPSGWLMWASISANQPRVGTGDLVPILRSGLILLGFLILVAFLGTISACTRGTLVQVAPTPAPARSFTVPE